MHHRQDIADKKRWVIKVGSALLTDNGVGLNPVFIESLAQQIADLRKQGVETLLVSSGSIVAGLAQLGMNKRPSKVAEQQAAAAVGQASLIRHYEEAFKPHGVTLAQVLLTHADIANRERYLNAKSTLLGLLSLDVLTVINENDTVATEEICFGDNDSLGALVANLVEADLLVILTDQDGLYTADPRNNPDAELLSEVKVNEPTLQAMATGGTSIGRGGMVTKLSAAQNASRSGAATIIAHGREVDILSRLRAGEELGTLLLPSDREPSRKQWMAGQMRSHGTLTLDDGAVSVLTSAGKSLLPVGITAVSGEFKRGELVSCVNSTGQEVARGLSNYSSQEAQQIKGQASDRISELLGYGREDELIHRDNLVLL